MVPERKIFCYESQTSWQTMGDGLRRQILGYDNQIMVVKIEAKSGAEGATHSHFHAQSTFIASGKFEFTVDGEVSILCAGDGVYLPPNSIHGFKCIEDGVVVDNFSPMREDFV